MDLLCEACQGVFQGEKRLRSDSYNQFWYKNPDASLTPAEREKDEITRYSHHSIKELDSSARHGCHLCVNLWRQLGMAELGRLRRYADASENNPNLDIHSRLYINYPFGNIGGTYQFQFVFPTKDQYSDPERKAGVTIYVHLWPVRGMSTELEISWSE
jgi:hypothetical protein